jgi:hypothetical protein
MDANTMTKPVFKGRGGGSGDDDKATRTPDSLHSTDTFEVLLGLGEGPWYGLAEGLQSFYFDDTPLVDNDNNVNFEGVEVQIYPGSDLGEAINLRLGGAASSNSVGVSLASGVTVTRTGTQTNIDYIDVRLVINQLLKTTDKGTFKEELEFFIEYKAESDLEWSKAFDGEIIDPMLEQQAAYTATGGGVTFAFTGFQAGFRRITFDGDRKIYWQSNTPLGEKEVGDLWFVSTNNITPSLINLKRWDGDSWEDLAYDPFTYYDVILDTDITTNIQFEDPDYFPNPTRTVWFGRPGDPAPAPDPEGWYDPPRAGDIWLSTSQFAPFAYNNYNWMEGAFNRADTTEVGTDGHIKFTEKTTSPTVKEYRFPVEQINEPYMVRVTKISPDSTTESIREIAWESWQEVQARTFTFPGTAAVRVLGKASDQLGRMPVFRGVWKMRLVKVPSNYDPTTRTYDGTWDGLWQVAWSDNPAYVFKDFVENERFGLSKIAPHTCVDSEIYEWGVWCDDIMADGTPRFTFNDYIRDTRSAKELAQYIAGSAAAKYVDDGDGNVFVLVDRSDEDPVCLFTKENIEGLFNYSYTDTQTRANELTVSFINPDLGWKPDFRLVQDLTHQDRYGAIPLPFVAVGCKNVKEAIRRAVYRMVSGIKETTIVSFRTNRKGLYCRPYNVILVGDSQMGWGLTGRIKERVSDTQILLRDPVTLEVGESYEAVFDIVNPDYPDTSQDPFITVTVPITTAEGTHTTLDFGDDLPELPDKAVFVIQGDGDTGTARPFRILRIDEVEDDPDKVDIAALSVYRNKWVDIEAYGEPGPGDSTTLPADGRPDPPTNIKVTESFRREGDQEVRVAMVSWEKSTTPGVAKHNIYLKLNESPRVLVASGSANFYEEIDLKFQHYQWQVTAVNFTGKESDPATVELDYTHLRPVLAVSHYFVKHVNPLTGHNDQDFFPKSAGNGGYIESEPVHVFGTDFELSWVDYPESDRPDGYELRLYDAGDSDPYKTMSFGRSVHSFVYSRAQNAEDHDFDARPPRLIGFGVVPFTVNEAFGLRVYAPERKLWLKKQVVESDVILTTNPGVTRYKVTLDDTVPINRLYQSGPAYHRIYSDSGHTTLLLNYPASYGGWKNLPGGGSYFLSEEFDDGYEFDVDIDTIIAPTGGIITFTGATGGVGQATLNWTKANDEPPFIVALEVLWNTSNNINTATNVGQVDPTLGTRVVTGLTAGTRWFWLRHKYSDGSVEVGGPQTATVT